ncbi:MAG: DUF2284 domain-containing protein [Nitrospina sp.]|jgi:predicted metal-binding protein|nr:DUF2284 domain-containing protein [Nitrospina sp.]MBT6716508.1 DUF2284 domain-containing protein [Nitrospina sp.]
MIPDNVKMIPKSIRSNQELIQEALDLGCTKAKVVLTQTISMAHWVKLHCQFGCSEYGKLLTCPPCTPESEEMAEIINEYEKALLINAGHDTNVQEIVVQLENSFKQKGYFKAFALGAKPCDLCAPCTISTSCQYPEKARPTLQACGIDVKSTVDKNGWADLAQQEPCSNSHTIGMVLLS